MKNYIYISIVLFVFQVSAQKKECKEVAFNSQKISIELHDVDHIEFIHTNEQKVTISMEDYAENPTHLIINETNEHIYITSTQLEPVQQVKKTEKFCAEEPFFSSYLVSIPKDVEIEMYYDNGNFTAKNFKGKLIIRLNKGDVDIQKFSGSIAVELFSGNINAYIENTIIDIATNNGTITSHLNSDKFLLTSTSLKGTYGSKSNILKVQSINANIVLNPVITQ